jgi:hypothetical protein
MSTRILTAAVVVVVVVGMAVLSWVLLRAEDGHQIGRMSLELINTTDDMHLDLEGADATAWVRRYDPERAASGYNLVLYRGRVPMIIDMNGHIVHLWPKVRASARARLNRHGRLIVTEKGNLVTEYDWDGNLTWSFQTPPRDFTHHDLIQLSNGNYLVLAKDYDSQRSYLTEVDRQQRVVWQWKTVDHLAMFPGWDLVSPDPGHINSINELPPNRWYVAGDQRFRPGNILVSARNLNTIFIIDKISGEVVWHYSKGLDFQHEAIMVEEGLTGEGMITVFNNGFNNFSDYRRSKILSIDPVRSTCSTDYESAFFFSATGGTARRLWRGNTLVTSTHGGRVFEIDGDRRIVWEWVPPGPVGRAERVPYDHCPQLAVLASPEEVEVESESLGPFVDHDLFKFAPRERLAKAKAWGKVKWQPAIERDCRELLIPPGAIASVEFGIMVDGLGEDTLSARFRLSIAEEGGEPESMIDVSVESGGGDSLRLERFSLRRFAYKMVTMCIETEARGSVENPMERAVWAQPKIRSGLQSPAKPRSWANISEEERLLRKRQLEALGYVE